MGQLQVNEVIQEVLALTRTNSFVLALPWRRNWGLAFPQFAAIGSIAASNAQFDHERC